MRTASPPWPLLAALVDVSGSPPDSSPPCLGRFPCFPAPYPRAFSETEGGHWAEKLTSVGMLMTPSASRGREPVDRDPSSHLSEGMVGGVLPTALRFQQQQQPPQDLCPGLSPASLSPPFRFPSSPSFQSPAARTLSKLACRGK